MMVTDLLMDESQPKPEVCVTDTVPVPAAPHNTSMLLELDEPAMVPPDTVQEYELPEIVAIEYVATLFEHALSGPAITGAGVGMMVTLILTAESQPNPEVWVTDTVPVPAAPHNTSMLLEVDEPEIAPPVTVQL